MVYLHKPNERTGQVNQGGAGDLRQEFSMEACNYQEACWKAGETTHRSQCIQKELVFFKKKSVVSDPSNTYCAFHRVKYYGVIAGNPLTGYHHLRKTPYKSLK